MDKINNNKGIYPIEITKEVKKSFLEYAMSVIVSRALPDVRDGLKPVHRRIIYAMNSLGVYSDKPYRKSAYIVGEVIGKYHPHGDTAIYDSLVRMAQDFSFRYPLIDGHGNFGSIDGDSAAAMRYTEVRMNKITMELVKDILNETVNFSDNYDSSLKEPQVLPSKFPNLLVNGSSGIAVGMATNMPPHNLKEVIDAINAYLDNNDITIDEIIKYIKGPDFPTGAQIIGTDSIKKAYHTGRGSLIVRSKITIKNITKNKSIIIIDEIPYQVNKANLIEKIASLVKEKKIEGIKDIRDESNRKGIRIVIELKTGVNHDIILNNLYKHTNLQVYYGINMVALVNSKPEILNIKQLIENYVKHQIEITRRKIKYQLNKTEKRVHILEGFKIVLDNVEKIINIIRYKDEPKKELMKLFMLSEEQTQAILDMKLRNLSKLESIKILEELKELKELIEDYKNILMNKDRVVDIIKKYLTAIKLKYSDNRRTKIIDSENTKIEEIDLVKKESIVLTISNKGYIKRVPINIYNSQNRGGRGKIGLNTDNDNFADHIVLATTHDDILFFTSKGKVYRLKGYKIPEYSKNAKGIPLLNLINIEKDEYITSVIVTKDYDKDKYLVFVTKKGKIKKVSLEEFIKIRATGKKVIILKDNDNVVSVKKVVKNNIIVLATSDGKIAAVNEDNIKLMNRNTQGVIGMRLTIGEDIVSVSVGSMNDSLLFVTKKGICKITQFKNFRVLSRGKKGIYGIKFKKEDKLVSTQTISNKEDQDIFLITNTGIVIRINSTQIKESSRYAKGSKGITLKKDEYVVRTALSTNTKLL